MKSLLALNLQRVSPVTDIQKQPPAKALQSAAEAPFQYSAAYYYYHGGLDYTFPDSHFGVRLGFRQLIYLAPDFQQNYLTITRRVRTSEPTFGFFARF
jgi:hypothetical protein